MSVNVSQNVQAIRKKLGFSEEQVSTYLGVTRSKLSNLYGVDMSVFFEENMDDFQQSLVCAFRTDGITPEDMHTIAKFKSIVNNYLKMCNLLK